MTNVAYPTLVSALLGGTGLSRTQVREAFEAILAGRWTAVQVAGFVVALRAAGETSEIISAATEAMRTAMLPVDHDLPVVLDTCGTGGDGSQTLNLSSGAAVLVAAAGVAVAKHGNRSASSRCGSADVFQAMGIPLDVPPARQGDVLREAGITFLFAPAHHPALKNAAQARSELGVRTIFNVLGPLANPARATHQLLGVYDDSLRPIVAGALAALGTRRAWVVRSEDGLDEVSPSAPTRVTEVADGILRERVVTPQDFGVAPVDRAAIAGGEAEHNARVLQGILCGDDHPAREALVLNAAAALQLTTGGDLVASAARIRSVIDDGAARATLETWKRAAIRARGA